MCTSGGSDAESREEIVELLDPKDNERCRNEESMRAKSEGKFIHRLLGKFPVLDFRRNLQLNQASPSSLH
ncbi:hypothetical protein SLE2022_342090 [Rubroshorea leprosula]